MLKRCASPFGINGIGIDGLGIDGLHKVLLKSSNQYNSGETKFGRMLRRMDGRTPQKQCPPAPNSIGWG